MDRNDDMIWILPASLDESSRLTLEGFCDDIQNIGKNIGKNIGAPETRKIILNLSACHFINFEGVALLLELVIATRKAQLKARLDVSDERLAHFLSFMQFETLIPIHIGDSQWR